MYIPINIYITQIYIHSVYIYKYIISFILIYIYITCTHMYIHTHTHIHIYKLSEAPERRIATRGSIVQSESRVRPHRACKLDRYSICC